MRNPCPLFVVTLLAACGHGAAPTSSSKQETPFAFTNGGFETGDTSGWTVTANTNPSTGIATVPPAQVSDLALATGGTVLTAAKTGATESVVPFGLAVTDTLRYPKYGQWAVEVNTKSSSFYLHGQNVNTLTQQMTTTSADVDTDGKVHVRFVLAPVIQVPVPAHATALQPYYYLEVRNVTKGTLLASSFHTVGDSGLPWKTSLAGAQYTDWQAFDVAPGGSALAVGDAVKVTALAAGCAVGDHYSVLYLDGFGTSLPGVSVVASAPSSVNAGDSITYTYTVRNGGSTAASNVVVTNNLPSGTTYLAIGANGAACTTPLVGVLGPVVCNVGTLNASASTTFTVTVKTSSVGTVVDNDYNAAALGGSPLIGPAVTTTVTQAVSYADLAITNSDGTSATTPGAPLVYTVVASNNGPSAATNAIVTDTFSAQLTNVTWTCVASLGATCGASAGTGSVNTTATLPSGGTATYTILGTVTTSATGSLVSTATIAAPGGVSDNVSTNNSAVDTDGIGTLHTITFAKVGVVGTGTVTSSPAAISCGPTCAAAAGQLVDGTTVTFTAVAASGSTFGGWSGACSGTGACTLTLTSDVAIGAAFVLPTFVVAASVPGGNGTVTCGSDIVLGSPDACVVVPNLGDMLVSLTDNGTDVTAQVLLGTYTLLDVSANHTLIAVFKDGLGTTCSSASDCGTGICVDGVCCNTACNGQCQACDVPGFAGTCTPVAGAPHGTRTACGGEVGCGGVCDGITTSACTFPTTLCSGASCSNGTASAASFCDGAGHCPAPATTSCGAYGCGALTCNNGCGATPCASGNYCVAGACLPQVAQGSICLSDAACGTGHCVDGICCDTACNGQCAACNVPGKLGTCSATTGAPVGPRPACTSDGLCGGTCDGTSQTACAYPTSACISASCSSGIEISSSACDGAGHCNVPAETSCGAFACGGSSCKATCIAQSDCGSGAFCLAGLCVPQLGQGQLCTDATQCGSGFCSGGVCCDTACDGSCSACTIPTHVGTCTPLTVGAACTQASCSLDIAVTGAACDGTGICIPGISTTCPLGCNGSSCNLVTVGDGGVAVTLPDLGSIVQLPDLGGVLHLPHPDLGSLPDLALPIDPLDLGQPVIVVTVDLGLGATGDMAQHGSKTTQDDMAHATGGEVGQDMAHASSEPGDMAPSSTASDMASPYGLRGGGCDMSGTPRGSLGAPLCVLVALFFVHRRRATVRVSAR